MHFSLQFFEGPGASVQQYILIIMELKCVTTAAQIQASTLMLLMQSVTMAQTCSRRLEQTYLKLHSYSASM